MNKFLIILLLSIVGISAHAQYSYYSSPAYVRQVQSRADAIMNNGAANIQRMINNAGVAAQQQTNRSLQMVSNLANWEGQFTNQNGRPPYEAEKDNWVRQNYPDMYNAYIQAKYSQGAPVNNNTNTSSQSQRECPYCNNGRVLIENSNVPTFGISIRYVKCNECGQQYNAAAGVHLHQSCTHCGGTGVLN